MAHRRNQCDPVRVVSVVVAVEERQLGADIVAAVPAADIAGSADAAAADADATAASVGCCR